MKTIGDLLSRDLSRKIEEIIQVDQADEQSVHDEITEYVATDSIREQYHDLFKAIAEAPGDPHESVGVWVSGFFGSGKSSFAKNLGYALENRKVLGTGFADFFKKQVEDTDVSDLLDLINAKTPTEVILFEVAKEADTRKVTQRIAELMYTVLLRELGYAEDFDIAELEIELEAEGKLAEFIATCKAVTGKEWEQVRAGAQKLSRASATLHKLNPKLYPSPDSWAHSQRNRDASISVSRVVGRTFELWGRRRKGKALVFIIDEVGQHVARSGDKIEDLRATIEEFGKVGKNLLKQHKIIAPCWIVVTSQEKLDEVVAAIDSKRVELAKLQDRFRYRVDLAPSDIREVATKRVLAKKENAEQPLKKLFADNQGQLTAALRLERTTRRTDMDADEFVEFYPYPPHYIDLCIGIMSGIRLQPGAPRHYGGSNRTIIKQAYEMLVSDRTAFAKKPIGSLVTLDKVLELVEGNLSNEKRTDIYQISERFKNETQDQGWALRVAKAICLLEFIRDLPRTEANLAAFLVDEIGKPAPLGEVQAAVKRLHAAQFIRNTEEGWKLQTAQEKNWETERRGHLEPKPRERNELVRSTLEQIFDEPEFKTFRFQNRSFRVGITVDGITLGDEGDLLLTLSVAEDADELTKRIDDVRTESQQNAHANDVYWLFSLTPEIDELVAQLHASRTMVDKYNQLSAQQKISPDEATCLQDEKNSKNGYETRVRDKLTEAMESGTGMFRGVQKDASSLGKTLSEILKKLFGQVVPDLYPKLQMGSRSLKGDEAEQILKAADLKALPSVFYIGEHGLGLVVKDGSKNIVNVKADVAKEVLDYLKSEDSYGNKDSRMGKALERRFGGTPYGWERDMLRLILAALFRAGEIEVTYQGNRFHNYQDPASRTPLTSNIAFRSSLFSPRQSVGLKTLTQAVQQLEDLTGEEVDVEEGAIATAFKKVASEELEKLYPLKATAEAHRLPILPMLSEYQQTLIGIQASASDDCVRILTENGPQFGEVREKVRNIRDLLDSKAIEFLRNSRTAIDQVWPRLSAHASSPEIAESVDELRTLLASDGFIDKLDGIGKRTRVVLDAYKKAYFDLFDRRRKVYESAIEEIRNHPEWGPLATKPEAASTLIAPLTTRLGTDEDRNAVAKGESLGKASLTEMDSDSGHFLLYCFDLLQTIYEEAYSDSDLGSALQADYETLDALRRDMPRLILAENLHGIDIDLRATQIAALALWLRCQRAFQEMGVKKERPRITRSNFVCAEPMPGEDQMLKEFVSQLEPKFLGQIVEVVFGKMKLAGEAGPLLKVEEEVRDAVVAAKEQWIRETRLATDRKGEQLLFTQAELDRIAGKPVHPSVFDLSDISNEQFFEQAEAKVIEALREYAEKTHNGHRLQRRLFSDDAVQGFAFVEACQKRYDVALMNPPFGSPTAKWKGNLNDVYPTCRSDLYPAFVSRAVNLLCANGIAGAITNRTALFLGGFAEWRQAYVYGGQSVLTVFADLGSNVLDSALVEVACYTLTPSEGPNRLCPSISLLGVTEKSSSLLSLIESTPISCSSSTAFAWM